MGFAGILALPCSHNRRRSGACRSSIRRSPNRRFDHHLDSYSQILPLIFQHRQHRKVSRKRHPMNWVDSAQIHRCSIAELASHQEPIGQIQCRSQLSHVFRQSAVDDRPRDLISHVEFRSPVRGIVVALQGPEPLSTLHPHVECSRLLVKKCRPIPLVESHQLPWHSLVGRQVHHPCRWFGSQSCRHSRWQKGQSGFLSPNLRRCESRRECTRLGRGR